MDLSSAVFCAPDSDIPWRFSGLRSIPCIRPIPFGKRGGLLVYLEGHRAPNAVHALLLSLRCDVLIQGDPLAFRPAECTSVALELEKQPDRWVCEFGMDYGESIESTLLMCRGDTRILASSSETASLAHAYLRGGDACLVHAGDAVYDVATGTRSRVRSPASVRVGRGCGRHVLVLLDDGREVSACQLLPRLVDHLGSFGSGECDTLVLLPDVGTNQARCAARRVRSLLLGVGWHPRCHLI